MTAVLRRETDPRIGSARRSQLARVLMPGGYTAGCDDHGMVCAPFVTSDNVKYSLDLEWIRWE